MYYNLHSLAAEVRRVKMARPVPQIWLQALGNMKPFSTYPGGPPGGRSVSVGAHSEAADTCAACTEHCTPVHRRHLDHRDDQWRRSYQGENMTRPRDNNSDYFGSALDKVMTMQ